MFARSVGGPVGPLASVPMQVVGAAGTAIGRVVLAARRGGVVGGDPERDQTRVLGRDAEPECDALCRLDRIALRLALVDDAAKVPRLVRQRDDAVDRAHRVLVAAAADQAGERGLVAAPDTLEAAARRRREARLVAGPAVLVEVDPAGVRRDLDEPRPETRTADVDVAQGDLARDERQPVLVLLAAHELPRGEQHQGDQQDEQKAHKRLIGLVRSEP